MPIDEKPSRNEEEYFARVNSDLIKERRAALDEQRRKQERAAHHMKCPKCGGDLKERQFHHVRIDECGDCHGVWLDKGELEMLEHVENGSINRFLRLMFRLKD